MDRVWAAYRGSRVTCSEGGPVADYDELAPIWRKSSRSNSQGCLEVAFGERSVLVRDSKHPDGPVLAISLKAWAAFVTQVRGSALGVGP